MNTTPAAIRQIDNGQHTSMVFAIADALDRSYPQTWTFIMNNSAQTAGTSNSAPTARRTGALAVLKP